MNLVHEQEQFAVYRADNCYIIQNTLLEGFKHSHVDSLKQAKKIIRLSIRKKIPHDLSRYLLESLYRVNDGEYRGKVKELLDNKRRKEHYYNVNKGRNRDRG